MKRYNVPEESVNVSMYQNDSKQENVVDYRNLYYLIY